MTMTPNIISIEPPGGWGGGGALPFAMKIGRRKGGMKVGLVSLRSCGVLWLIQRGFETGLLASLNHAPP